MFNYNLDYLRSFYYVAKLGSFSKASNVIYVSQPAISSSISKLEKYFGAKLLNRLGKEVTLTEEGAVLYKHVESAIEGLIIGERELAVVKEHAIGALRIVTTETPLYNLVLPKIRPFHEKYPGVFMSISGGGSVAEAFEQLNAGQADLAFGVTPLSDEAGFEIINIDEFEDIAVAGSTFRALRDKVLTRRELVGFPIIATKRGTNARANLDDWFAEYGVAFEPAYSIHTASAVLVFAMHNVGIGILPSSFAKTRLADGSLFQIKLDVPFPKRRMFAAYRKAIPLSIPASAFLDLFLS
jgi:DNA-binding transcriptional LysR family regulator